MRCLPLIAALTRTTTGTREDDSSGDREGRRRRRRGRRKTGRRHRREQVWTGFLPDEGGGLELMCYSQSLIYK